jgi:hypothetical protein
MLRLIKANQAPEKQPIFLFLVLLVCVSCCWWLCDLVMAQCEFSGVTQKDHESNATKKSTNKIFEFLEHPTPGSHNPCRRQWSVSSNDVYNDEITTDTLGGSRA